MVSRILKIIDAAADASRSEMMSPEDQAGAGSANPSAELLRADRGTEFAAWGEQS